MIALGIRHLPKIVEVYSQSSYKQLKQKMNMNSFNKLSISKYFYAIELTQKEIKNYKHHSKAKQLRKKSISVSKIATELGISKRKLEHWFYEGTRPLSIHLVEKLAELKHLKVGRKWLSINNTKGGMLIGPWIQVPMNIKTFEDVKEVLDQIDSLPEADEKLEKFDLFEEDNQYLKYYLFYYLLGVIVGDGAISRGTGKIRITRRIILGLSKRFLTNERLGEFVSLCVNSIGLKINRIKDGPKSKKNRHLFYRWESQCSALAEWIFDVCFKLAETENTTYTPIKANWILKSPTNLRVAFLQGIADSDGYVDIGVAQIGLITKSNGAFIEKLLDSLNVHHTRKHLHHGTLPTIMIHQRDAYKMPIFNPHVKSYRHKLVEQLSNAQRLDYKLPETISQEVTNYLKNGSTSTDIVKLLLNKYNILVRGGSIQKRMHTLKKLGVIQV